MIIILRAGCVYFFFHFSFFFLSLSLSAFFALDHDRDRRIILMIAVIPFEIGEGGNESDRREEEKEVAR